jgi:hypothetical protein
MTSAAEASPLDDESFLAALEATTLPPAQFDHRGHLRAAFLYLRRHDFPGACVAMKASIRAYARALGAHGLYHETMTVAYLSLVAERLAGEGPEIGFERFLARYPELASRAYFERYYPRGTLDTDEARTTFVLPRPRDAD